VFESNRLGIDIIPKDFDSYLQSLNPEEALGNVILGVYEANLGIGTIIEELKQDTWSIEEVTE